MLASSFFEILAMFLIDSNITQPSIFGLEDFSRAELERKKYELVGALSDLHFYEKDYSVCYYRKSLNVVFKRYFYAERDIGSGFSVSPGLRLISLLKWYESFSSSREPTTVIAFYFSEDKEEGAVILRDSIVLRFNQWDRRGGYSVATIESDFSESNILNKIATDSVKKTMQPYEFHSPLPKPNFKGNSVAFCRLLRYLSKIDVAR